MSCQPVCRQAGAQKEIKIVANLKDKMIENKEAQA